MSGALVVVGGGVRCGKSAFALEMARERAAGSPITLIATAEARDDEMRARIAAHRAERGAEIETIEAPIELASALARAREGGVAVVDCLTLWLTNLLLADRAEADILRALADALDVAAARCLTLVVVTNEVGMGIVPESPLARAFRDLAGRAHQLVSRRASEVYVGILGVLLRVKPGLALVDAHTEAP